MTEPKYHCGQRVAVCTGDLSIVIPETWIESVDPFFCGAHQHTGRWAEGLIAYRVHGQSIWLQEKWLRPLKPGDYKSISDLLTKPVENAHE